MSRLVASFVIVAAAAIGLGQGGKPASTSTGTATSNAATAPASGPAATPEAAWAAVVNALKAGDKKALAEATTPKGYKSIMGKDDFSQAEMRSRGRFWSELKIEILPMTETTAEASFGHPMKLNGLRFVKTADGWKFDELLPGA